MIQYFEAFLFIFIPLFAWGLISYNLLIRDKIRVDTSIEHLRSVLQEKLTLTSSFIKHVSSEKEMQQQLMEATDQINITADIIEFLSQVKNLDKLIVQELSLIEQNKELSENQPIIDMKHQFYTINTQLEQLVIQYERNAKYMNIRMETFPANVFAALFRIKPASQTSKIN